MSVAPESVPAGFRGADVDALDAFGRRLTEGADALGGIRSARTGDLAVLAWLGQDRYGFEEQWRTGHAVAMQRVEDALREAAARVDAQAGDQRRASEGGTGGTGGTATTLGTAAGGTAAGAAGTAAAGVATSGNSATTSGDGAGNDPDNPIQTDRYGHPSGSITARYESGGRTDLVSSGVGDPGGASSGRYQISEGTMPAYVRWAREHDPAAYAALRGKSPGSDAFREAWRGLAQADPQGFGQRQYEFIEQTHYRPAVEIMERAAPGFTMNGRSQAVGEAIWSMSVQHPPGGISNIVRHAFAGQDISRMTDSQIITALYDERGRDNGRRWFPSSPPRWQRNISARMQNEKRDVLSMFDGQ